MPDTPDGPLRADPLSHPTSEAILAALVGFDTTSRYADLALVDRLGTFLERLVLHCKEPS